ncbi:MAG TPA: hypothetical protein VI277_00505 [Candidatus Limnocylindria bacterium]
MHANTQPIATNNFPTAARAVAIAAIVIVAAGAGFMTGTALQGSDSGAGSPGRFSAAESVYTDLGLRVARQEASAVSAHQELVYADLGLQIARQEASAFSAQTSATWETDRTGPAPR